MIFTPHCTAFTETSDVNNNRVTVNKYVLLKLQSGISKWTLLSLGCWDPTINPYPLALLPGPTWNYISESSNIFPEGPLEDVGAGCLTAAKLGIQTETSRHQAKHDLGSSVAVIQPATASGRGCGSQQGTGLETQPALRGYS